MKEGYNTSNVFKQRKETDLELHADTAAILPEDCCSAVWKWNASIESPDKEKLTSNFDHLANLFTFIKFSRKWWKGRKIKTNWESWLFTNFPLRAHHSNYTIYIMYIQYLYIYNIYIYIYIYIIYLFLFYLFFIIRERN